MLMTSLHQTTPPMNVEWSEHAPSRKSYVLDWKFHYSVHKVYSEWLKQVRPCSSVFSSTGQRPAGLCHGPVSGMCQSMLNPFPNKPWFLQVCSASLLKTLRDKEKLLETSNFSFSPSVFYWFGELSAVFMELEIFVCKLFQFGRV